MAREGIWDLEKQEKRCPKCEQFLPFSSFGQRTDRAKYPNGLRSTCKLCSTEAAQAYRKIAPAVKRSARRGSWKRQGMCPDEAESVWKASTGSCAICGDTKESLYVDHDHNTGKVRGMLCPQCNTGLGQLRDSEDILKKALRYLEGHNAD